LKDIVKAMEEKNREINRVNGYPAKQGKVSDIPET